MLTICMTPGCLYSATEHTPYCPSCIKETMPKVSEDILSSMTLGSGTPDVKPQTMAEKYPKYYKAIPKEWDSIDVYGVCKLFPVADDTGCIHHAVKKLLVPGTRTGGKSFYDDIKEARDTLTRWLELNPQA